MSAEQEESHVPPTHEQLVDEVIWRSVRSSRVLYAFRKVDRSLFIPDELAPFRQFAHENSIIPLGDGASLSQPEVVAHMIDFLDLTGGETVLEVGTGAGYTAALLSHLASYVHTIEHNEKLVDETRQRFLDLGYKNIEIHTGDGALGLPQQAPFDAIIVTAGARKVPRALYEQLSEGGRMVVPTGQDPDHLQLIVLLKGWCGKTLAKSLGKVNFHPLMSAADGGWTEETLTHIVAVKLDIVRELADQRGKTVEEMLEVLGKELDIPPGNQGLVLKKLEFPDEIYLTRKIKPLEVEARVDLPEN